MKNEQYLDWNYDYLWGEFEYSGRKQKLDPAVSRSRLLLNGQSNIFIQVGCNFQYDKLWNPEPQDMLSHPRTLKSELHKT